MRELQRMAAQVALNQSELKLLVKAQTVSELIAIPMKDRSKIVWILDVVLSNGDLVTYSASSLIVWLAWL